jgi:hypothetical protein
MYMCMKGIQIYDISFWKNWKFSKQYLKIKFIPNRNTTDAHYEDKSDNAAYRNNYIFC